MKIAIGCDHVGLVLKPAIVAHLEACQHEVIDVGTNQPDRTDYPIYSRIVAGAINDGSADAGILLCGTGVGISIAANKIEGIRAVVCSDPYSAKLSREHNNTNILSMGSRVVGEELAKMIVDAWLGAGFEGGRHQKRVEMISEIEREQSHA